MRYIGGGHKRKYRIIDFKRNKYRYSCKSSFIEYDPNRSARIALLFYADGEKRYILAPEGLKVGQTVLSGSKASPEVGNAMFLKDIPLGTIIHNIEMTPGKGGAIARSAGSYAQLNARDGKYAIIKVAFWRNKDGFNYLHCYNWFSIKFRKQSYKFLVKLVEKDG